MRNIKILAISGSLRKGSFNTALLRAAQSCAPAGCQIEMAAIHEIPLYNYDDEVAKGIPAIVEELKERIVAADALLICTPEYNHGIPGVLKNALDWCTRPIEDVPRVFAQLKVGLIGASPSRLGTAFSQTAWLPVLRYLNTHTCSLVGAVIAAIENTKLQALIQKPPALRDVSVDDLQHFIADSPHILAKLSASLQSQVLALMKIIYTHAFFMGMCVALVFAIVALLSAYFFLSKEAD